MDWTLTPTPNLAKEASSKCGTLKATWFSMLFCSFIQSFIYSFAHSFTHRVYVQDSEGQGLRILGEPSGLCRTTKGLSF